MSQKKWAEQAWGRSFEDILNEAREQGTNLHQLSKKLGVPYSTLRRWEAQLKPHPLEE